MTKSKKQRITRKQRLIYDSFVAYLNAEGFSKGDQIPAFPEMAKKLGASVTLLQKVVPLLVADGVIDAVSKVGMFFRALPKAESSSDNVSTSYKFDITPSPESKQRIVRFYTNEMEFPAAAWWRKIVFAFERKNPGVRINLTMLGEENKYLAGPDVFLVQNHNIPRAMELGVDWKDNVDHDKEQLLEPLRQSLDMKLAAKLWPIAFNMNVLYVNKAALDKKGLYCPDRWTDINSIIETCKRYSADDNGEMFGLAYNDIWLPLFLNGFGITKVESSVRESLHQYISLVSQVYPPLLVTSIESKTEDVVVSLLKENKVLFAIGTCWYNSFLNHDDWVVLNLPRIKEDPSFSVHSTLWAAVNNRSEVPDAAADFANFLYSEEAQGILASFNGLLPANKNVTQKHAMHSLLADDLQFGWINGIVNGSETIWTGDVSKAAVSLMDVRSGRTSADCAEKIIFECKPYNNFKLSFPAS